MIRKIKRNILKKHLGTNKIRLEWYRLQIQKFGGYKEYWKMRNACKKHGTQKHFGVIQ